MPIDYDRPEPRPATLLERVAGSGISEDRARRLIVSGAIRTEGDDDQPITDPDASFPWPQRWCHAPAN